MEPTIYYSNYLCLDKVLGAQHPRSYEQGNQPAHDEMLFIIVHQAYELWFKQILFELDFVCSVFKKDKIDDNSEDLNLVRHRLRRIVQILELLNQQVALIETMTPLDFLEFRDLLAPSSGFQSLQFRLVEARLGLKMHARHQVEYYKRASDGGLSNQDLKKLDAAEKEQSLKELINKWLERMPFFENELWKDYGGPGDTLHPFWAAYRNIYETGLTKIEESNINGFDFTFFSPENETNDLKATLSTKAMRAALFIMLYRDFPVFQTSYQILDSLVKIDHQMAGWRLRHLAMVRQMIGLRSGTGNTSGSAYLEGAFVQNNIFSDLESLSTFLIERKKLPGLPVALIKKLSYSL